MFNPREAGMHQKITWLFWFLFRLNHLPEPSRTNPAVPGQGWCRHNFQGQYSRYYCSTVRWFWMNDDGTGAGARVRAHVEHHSTLSWSQVGSRCDFITFILNAVHSVNMFSDPLCGYLPTLGPFYVSQHWTVRHLPGGEPHAQGLHSEPVRGWFRRPHYSFLTTSSRKPL